MPVVHHLTALNDLAGAPVSKVHATGNDFVMLMDPRAEWELSVEQVAALCDRHLGLGADGLIRAVPAHRAQDPGVSALMTANPELASTDAAPLWFMDYRNGDGSIAEMCGNGVRAFALGLEAEGLLQLDAEEEVVIVTRAGVRTLRKVAAGYAVGMGVWAFIDPDMAQQGASDSLVMAAGIADPRPALSISMGNPHTVVALPDIEALEALELREKPTVDPEPPNGTNVEFVVPAEPLVSDGVGRVHMRVHERGVGETMSCGTGACAAAAAVRVWAGEDAVSTWDVVVPGGEVTVRFIPRPDGAEEVELSGPAERIIAGTLQ